MGDEDDRQIGAKRKRILFSRRAEEQTHWLVGDDRQLQGAKRKSMLVRGTKSRHEYLQGRFTA